MTNERKSWIINLLLGLIAILVIVLVIYWLFPMPELNTFYDKVFNENIQTMKTAARDYYTVNRLPQNVGETTRMTLAEMENNKLIIPFVDKDNKKCDTNNSYIQVTKTLDNEYALKVQLACGDKIDYIIDTIGCNETCANGNCNVPEEPEKPATPSKPSTSTKPSTTPNKPSTTTKPTTPNKPATPTQTTTKYTVTFDTAGGSTVASQTVVKNGTVTVPGAPVRSGYIFTGWYYDGKLYDFSTKVTKNMTIVAHWDKVTSDVSNLKLYFEHAPLKKVYGSEMLTVPNGLYETEVRKLRYYEFYQAEQNDYYSVGYITKSQYEANKNKQGTWTYSYELELKNTHSDMTRFTIIDKDEMTSLADFTTYVNTRDENIAMVGGNVNSPYKVYTSAREIKNASLNANHFYFRLSTPVLRKGHYYVTVTVTITNLKNATSYKASNVSEPVYFVPITFRTNCTNKDNIVVGPDMLGAGVFGQRGEYLYSLNKTIYKPYRLERDMSKAIWSTETKVDGYEATGKVEWRNN